jgi:hypothetical protein
MIGSENPLSSPVRQISRVNWGHKWPEEVMSEQDMAILIQNLFHYLNPQSEIPSQAHVITTIREMRTRNPGWE